jgi:ATP-dependent RNA helicase RhlB
MPQTHLTDTRFDQFDLHPKILAGLATAGFEYCTPIQAETLPVALAGRDVAGQAQTGTGKTAAFLVVALQRLLRGRPEPAQVEGDAAADAGDEAAEHPESDQGRRRPRQPRALILAPTRELAVQIHKDAEVLASQTGFRLGLVYGGTGYQAQRDEVSAGVDILIGTPGRLIDYLKQRVFDLHQVEVVVLDEADRMFDLGFIKDIRFVLRRLPSPTQRLGLLFSATLSYRVMELAYEHMNDPQMIEITPERVTADRVTQRGYMVANDEKIPLLIGLLRQLEGARSMVFVNTKREGERVWGYLEGNGLKAAMLSGDVPQKKRLSLLKRFQDGDLMIMVATDVAARGLHIPGVSHVINYDLPDDAEDYVHRIGRTARAGAAGDAISFVCESYAMGWPDIEAFVGARIPISTVEPEILAAVDPKSRVRVERSPRDTQRGPRRGPQRGARRDAQRGPRQETGQASDPDGTPRKAERAHDTPRRGATPQEGAREVPVAAVQASEAAADGASRQRPPQHQQPQRKAQRQPGAESSAAGAEQAPQKRRRRRSRRRSTGPNEPAPQA